MAPSDTSLVTAHAFYLKTTYDEYPAHAGLYTSLPVTVTTSGCDCELLRWDDPSAAAVTVNVGVVSAVTQALPPATVRASSKDATAAQNI